MQALEVFFDYICPFCYEAHEYLQEIMSGYPELEVIYRPCEAHPRPDSYGPHSDLMIQGFFLAEDRGVDMQRFHQRMYAAAHVDRIDVEQADALAAYTKDLIPPKVYLEALNQGRYLEALSQANDYAYTQSDVWVVPAYRLCGQALDAEENIGTTKMELRQFIQTVL